MKKVILTGDRPTGRLHIGHYLGSIKNRVRLQDDYEQYIIIADVQALTDNFNDPKKVRDNVMEVAMDNLACGVDHIKSTIFIQSMIPEIAELTIFYSNLVTVARLQRNPTVKTEINQKKEIFGSEGNQVTYGFLGYPISQTADITAFNADVVPVGEDQLPMIEQAREIVRKFNSLYNANMTEPEAIISKISRVKGLDGNEKMSKSLNNAIYLSDDEGTIQKKVMSALTDKNRIHKTDKGDPNVCTVAYYHKLFSTSDEIKKVFYECKNGLRGCADCKKQLAKNINIEIKPIREKRKYYEQRPELVKDILMKGTAKARLKARQVMKMVRKSMQIDYFEDNKK